MNPDTIIFDLALVLIVFVSAFYAGWTAVPAVLLAAIVTAGFALALRVYGG